MLASLHGDTHANNNRHLELLSDDVGFRVARFAGGRLVHVEHLEQGTHEVQRTHCGVLKEGEGLQDEAATRRQNSQRCHQLTVVQRSCAHFLQATTACAVDDNYHCGMISGFSSLS